MPRPPADPYAPPPLHRDRSGAVVQIAILAVLIAGVGFGWMYFSNHQQTAELAQPAAEGQQQLADNGGMPVYQTNSATAPEAAPAPVAPTPAPAPARRAAPSRSAPADAPSQNLPPPTTSSAPPPVDGTTPSTPTPLPPSDQGE